MVGYVMLGTNDLERAARFYDALLAEVGAARFMDEDRFVVWGTAPDQPMLSVTVPHDDKPATVGNGVMVALAADTRAQVDALYAKAISLGATDEGAPGDRGEGFYAGYFRDPDGNKLNAYKTD
jgi:predicted lactoylglutathione lyase